MISSTTFLSHPDDLSKPRKTGIRQKEHQAPDGGWGWVIVAGFWIMQFLVTGFTFSFGVMYVKLKDQFSASAAIASVAGSINVGIVYLISPLSTALSSRFSVRSVVLLGALMLGLGTVTCAFSPNIYFFIFAYSIIGGVGAAFTFTPAIILLNHYFDRYRSVANGLCNSGSSFGVFIFPLLMNSLFNNYSFMGTLLIIGALQLNNCAIACTFRPTKYKYLPEDEVITNNINPDLGSDMQTKDTSASTKSALDEPTKQDESTEGKSFKATRYVKCNMVLKKLMCGHQMPTYRLICTCCALTLGMVGYVSSLQLLVDYCKNLGYTEDEGVFLMSAVGITDGVGRLVIGAILDIPRLKAARKFICVGLLFAASVANIAVGFCSEYIGLAITSIILGSFHGILCSQRAILIIDLFGLDNLSSGFGLVMASSGIGILFGPTLPAWLKDITGVYKWSFVCNGILSLCGSVILLVLCVRQRRV